MFRDLDWLARISGTKIMAHKPNFDKNSTPTNVDPEYIIPMAMTGHNSPAESARELFKPSKDSKSLDV